MSALAAIPVGSVGTAACPHVLRGDWLISPAQVLFRGRVLDLKAQEVHFLDVLATAKLPVRVRDMGVRIAVGSSEGPDTLAKVTACRLRAKLPVVPFETVWGRGYRWVAE